MSKEKLSKKEVLLAKFKKIKEKLEIRKKRFQLWQEEIDRKDEKGIATIQELKKNLVYWVKEQRLSDRIDFFRGLISGLEKDLYKKEAI